MYNNETNSTEGPFEHSSVFYMVTISTSVIIAILSPVAVVGNGLVLAAIWRNPSLRTPSYILLAGLAFTDFGTGLITQPFHFANEIIYLAKPQLKIVDNWPTFYLITKSIANGFGTLFFSSTILIITAMSIERWLHMSRRSLVTVRRACLIVAVLLLLPIPLVVFRVKVIPSK